MLTLLQLCLFLTSMGFFSAPHVWHLRTTMLMVGVCSTSHLLDALGKLHVRWDHVMLHQGWMPCCSICSGGCIAGSLL